MDDELRRLEREYLSTGDERILNKLNRLRLRTGELSVCDGCEAVPATTECHICSTEVCKDEDCSYECENCDKVVELDCDCDPPCHTRCVDCERFICSECNKECFRCDHETCENCQETCNTCENEFCGPSLQGLGCIRGCPHCGSSVCVDCMEENECIDCQRSYCGSCQEGCESCKEPICPESTSYHKITCGDCQGVICNDCMEKCDDCSETICKECKENSACDTCERGICKGCFLVCQSCMGDICSGCTKSCNDCDEETLCQDCVAPDEHNCEMADEDSYD